MSEKLRNSEERRVEKQGDNYGKHHPKSETIKESTREKLYNNLKK